MSSRESAASQAGVSKRSRSVRRRFLIVGVAALAVLGVMMGVSFLDSSGATSLNISSSSSTLVIPLDNGTDASLPLGDSVQGPLTTTAFSGASTLSNGGTCTSPTQGAGGVTTGGSCSSPSGNTLAGSNIVNPSWSPIASSPGTVTKSGDLAVVDATTATNYVTVNMYITNLTALGVDYSSFAFPINVYEESNCTSDGNCDAWTEELSSPSYTYLTDTSGVLTFNLAAGAYYDIVMEGTDHTASNLPDSPTTGPSSPVGGSFYTTQTNGSGGSLSPSFYFTATAS